MGRRDQAVKTSFVRINAGRRPLEPTREALERSEFRVTPAEAQPTGIIPEHRPWRRANPGDFDVVHNGGNVDNHLVVAIRRDTPTLPAKPT